MTKKKIQTGEMNQVTRRKQQTRVEERKTRKAANTWWAKLYGIEKRPTIQYSRSDGRSTVQRKTL